MIKEFFPLLTRLATFGGALSFTWTAVPIMSSAAGVREPVRMLQMPLESHHGPCI